MRRARRGFYTSRQLLLETAAVPAQLAERSSLPEWEAKVAVRHALLRAAADSRCR